MLAAAWAPPTMAPWFRTPANIKPPSRASSPPTPIAISGPIAVSGRSPLRFAFRCGKRQAHAESYCPTGRIPDYLTAIDHSLQPLCMASGCWGARCDERIFLALLELQRWNTQAWCHEHSRITREHDG